MPFSVARAAQPKKGTKRPCPHAAAILIGGVRRYVTPSPTVAEKLGLLRSLSRDEREQAYADAERLEIEITSNVQREAVAVAWRDGPEAENADGIYKMIERLFPTASATATQLQLSPVLLCVA